MPVSIAGQTTSLLTKPSSTATSAEGGSPGRTLSPEMKKKTRLIDLRGIGASRGHFRHLAKKMGWTEDELEELLYVEWQKRRIRREAEKATP